MRWIRYLLISSFLLSEIARADYTALQSANNQVYTRFLWGHQNLIYHGNDSYGLYNLHGNPYGLEIGITKTFSRLYTAINLSATNASLSYNNPAYVNRSDAASYMQQANARLGILFYPNDKLNFTPYLTLGYQHWQLDTGGQSGLTDHNQHNNNAPIRGYLMNGFTQVFQSVRYGIGLLSQWAVTPQWVLGGDLTLGGNYHSWTYATNGRQANVANQLYWEAAVNSDYRLNSDLHGLLGIKYKVYGTGTGQTQNAVIVPAQQSHLWEYSAGIAYDLDTASSNITMTDHRQALIDVNNQARINFGYLFQNYGEISPGKPGYSDRQAGHLPVLAIAINKTWRNVYGQLSVSEAIGETRYIGQDAFPPHTPILDTTHNTMDDISARLGYQFFVNDSISLTPYGVLGYHRWLRALGYPETYHHNWAGIGGLLQFAPSSQWVFTIDGNVGNTFNSQMHTWLTFYDPYSIMLRARLGSRSYIMGGAGFDYQFIKRWHFQAGINYWRFNYGKSQVEPNVGDEPTSNTRLLTATIGIGYGLG